MNYQSKIDIGASVPPRAQTAGEALVGLDALRGVAALLVLVSHTRHFVFNDYGSGAHTAVGTTFYAVTGVGHQAVIAFFVLSGFLISRSVVRLRERHAWSWHNYLAHRLARLWTVLVPCLLLTFALDLTTIVATHSKFYAGQLSFYSSGPSTAGVNLSTPAFLGNLLFLQTLAVPVFGSNGPLWSLANEFWYYIAFPLIFMLPTGRLRETILLLSAPAAVALGGILHEQLLQLWPAWLLGYYAFRLSGRILPRSPAIFPGDAVVLATLAAATLLSVAASRVPGVLADLALAVCFAAGVIFLARVNNVSRSLSVAATWSARVSFSLYLSHFPLLAALSATVLGNRRSALDPTAFGWFSVFCLASLALAAAIYFAIEQHTISTRRWLIASSMLLSTRIGIP